MCLYFVFGSAVTKLKLEQKQAEGRGLHSSTFQLNLSRVYHEMHPKYPLIPFNTL